MEGYIVTKYLVSLGLADYWYPLFLVAAVVFLTVLHRHNSLPELSKGQQFPGGLTKSGNNPIVIIVLLAFASGVLTAGAIWEVVNLLGLA